MEQLSQNQTPPINTSNITNPEHQNSETPKWVVDSEDKFGYIRTEISPSQIGFMRKWGIFLTIPLIPIGPFLYMLIIRRLYKVHNGIVYQSSRKQTALTLAFFGIASLLIMIRGIIAEL